MGFVPIEGAEGYFVNELGEVLGKQGKLLKIFCNPRTGYYDVRVRRNGKQWTRTVHRIVAENLLPRVEGKTHVNHIDGDKSNNHLSNLEWCTRSENQLHAYRTGLISKEGIASRGIKAGIGARNNLGKRIKLIHKDGHTHEFDSVRHAAKQLGLDYRTLSRVTNKKKHFHTIQGYSVEVVERG